MTAFVDEIGNEAFSEITVAYQDAVHIVIGADAQTKS